MASASRRCYWLIVHVCLLGGRTSAFNNPLRSRSHWPSPKNQRSTSTPQELSELSMELLSYLSTSAVVAGAPISGRIDEIISKLCAATCTFCLQDFGEGLWVARYNRGGDSDPRWKKSAAVFERLLPFVNLSGQRYFAPASDGDERGDVCNYSEICGQAVYLRACGKFSPKRTEGQGITCPCDFTVSIESGGVVVFGQSINFPISGNGLLRVLYSDANCRILLSPADSPDKWESAGLVVVQVPVEKVLAAESEGGRKRREGWVQPRC